MRRNRIFLTSVLTISILFLGGCASFNKSHTTNFAANQALILQGKTDIVAANLAKKAKNSKRESVLYALEAAYLYMFQNDYEKSKELYEYAFSRINDYEQRAKLNVRGVGSSVKAAFSSDMELPYKGQIFEKITAHTFQALNYMFLNDLEGANVEVRRAEMRQKEAVDQHQKELKKLEKLKKDQNVDDKSVSSVMNNFGVLDEYSSKVINSFQNGFTYYIGGLIYELNKSDNDAYIDYRKSFDLFKNRSTLEKLIILSNELNMKEDIDKWNGLYKELYSGRSEELMNAVNDPESGELVVIKFSGGIPRKVAQKFSLWTSTKSFNVAFPFYMKDDFYYQNEHLKVYIDGDFYGKTEVAVDYIPITIKALKEKMPGVIARQVVRLIAKNLAEAQARKRGGLLGGLLAKVVNKVTERADLRGWYELPANIQILNAYVPAGAKTLDIDFYSGDYKDKTEQIDINIKKGECTVVMIQVMTGNMSIHKLEQ